ncbi:MAG: pilin [Candidatus Berkelbacteria bacterium]|nr:pilin [Candidatus Berkelbacteria bacterium]
MKKIIVIISLLFLCLIPLYAFALDQTNLTVDPVFRSYADLQSQGQMDIPVHFKLHASSSELAEVKMIKISVQDTCPGKSGAHVQQGDFRPAPDDYQDGVIEGDLIYQADKTYSCKGKHDVNFYLCNKISDRCTWASVNTDRIAIIAAPDVVEIGDNPPASSSNPPPSSSVSAPPPADGGGAGIYDPLLPGRGRFLTLWDLLARIVQILLGLAGVVAVGAIIIGGYQYMTSGGIPDKTQIAKATITYAIIGLILVIAFYAAMRFIFARIGVSPDIIWF